MNGEWWKPFGVLPETLEPAKPTVNEFDYYGTLEILGWTFRVKTDGTLVVHTSNFVAQLDENGKTSALMQIGPGNVKALRALLDQIDGGESYGVDASFRAPGVGGFGVIR